MLIVCTNPPQTVLLNVILAVEAGAASWVTVGVAT